MVIDAVNTANSDAVVVFNYQYSNLDEIRAEGFDLLYGGNAPKRERNIRKTILENLPEAVELS